MRPLLPALTVLLAAASAAEPVVSPGATGGGGSAEAVVGDGLPPAGAILAGHQRTVAVRQVPLLGAIKTYTDIYSVAKVLDDEAGHRVIVDKPCRIDVSSNGGVELDFDPASVARLPSNISRWSLRGDGTAGDAEADPWTAGWGDLDVDADGRPGMQVRVHAPVCGGWLDIASTTKMTATARWTGQRFAGDVAVHIDRRILDASNPCLGLVSKHNLEDVDGTFAFEVVPDDATCESVAQAGWPATP